MRAFEYRAPRFLANTRFEFETGNTSVPGTCTNISLGGVSALVEEDAPAVGGSGSLTLRYDKQHFTLAALVTHVDGQEVGFSFVQRTEEERAAARDFAAFLEAQVPNSVGRHTD